VALLQVYLSGVERPLYARFLGVDRDADLKIIARYRLYLSLADV
jgi:hypothetical protein